MNAVVERINTENSDFQYIETLRRNRTKRNRSREFFVEGVRAINQAIQWQWDFNALIFTRDTRLSDWARGIIENSGARKHCELPQNLLDKLSQKEEASELIALIKMPEDDLHRIPEREPALIVVLDRPTNPGNIGTIIRSCDALKVDGVIITGHAADLYDPETIRATTGSFFSVPAVRVDSHKELIPWIEGLRSRSGRLQIVGTSAKATIPLQDFDFTVPTVLLVGSETHGLSENFKALSDAMVTIPMSGYASSLNVACATSIVLYEISRQRQPYR
jgi:23S rRNA (uridine2479-2'-O)-methyltransferase